MHIDAGECGEVYSVKFSKGGRIVFEVNTGFSTRGERGVWTDMIKVCKL